MTEIVVLDVSWTGSDHIAIMSSQMQFSPSNLTIIFSVVLGIKCSTCPVAVTYSNNLWILNLAAVSVSFTIFAAF